jgi:hypothetical protein
MRIIIDISHLAHLNFFRNAIQIINKEKKHSLLVTVLDRGPLMKIAKEELKDVKIVKSGKHRGGVISILFEANFIKFFRLIYFCLQFQPQIGLSCGGFVLGAIMRFSGKKNIQFDDDPERKINVFLERITATRLYFPPIIKAHKNIIVFNGLKEWAYLSPKYFHPDLSSLNIYQLEKRKYVFVRIVGNDTLNYISQDKKLLVDLLTDSLKDSIVVLSLEKKADISYFPSNWLVLKEPVVNIHSIMYYSKLIISTGDSMAREGAMLGVPSIYCGGREMKANDFLESYGLFIKTNPEKLFQVISEQFKKEVDQISFQNELNNSWDDINKLIISQTE